MRHITQTNLAPSIRAELNRNKSMGCRTYGPMRRALCGQWLVEGSKDSMVLALHADSTFTLAPIDSNRPMTGKFWMASAQGKSYLVLEAANAVYALSVDGVAASRIVLSWADAPQEKMAFVRLEGFVEVQTRQPVLAS